MPKTKIIATLGPSSSTETIIRKMVMAGLDVARFNFSHGTYLDHLKVMEIVRKINKKYRRHIRLLQDLKGNRIRVGKFKNHVPIELKKRQIVFLTQQHVLGEKNLIPFDYRKSLKSIRIGQFIYIDDGNISLKVIGKGHDFLKTIVIVGGILKENKGINIPNAKLQFPTLNCEDRKDIEFAIKNKFDYIAQSFVRTKEDIIAIRKITKTRLPECKIIAKIECADGIKNLNEILKVSDGIMIARGDMGISVPIYQIPIIQKQIIKKCNQAKKIVITATQMLESMTDNPVPTRAEVTDVANAILDGTDYVMLSAETAAGKYPVESVQMMNEIIKYTEKSYNFCRY